MNKNKYLNKAERVNHFIQKGETQFASTSLNNPYRGSSINKQAEFFDPHMGIIRTSDSLREEPTYTDQGKSSNKFNIFSGHFNLIK